MSPRPPASIETIAARTYDDHRRINRPLSVPLDRATTFQAASAEEHARLFREKDPAFYQRFNHPTTAAAAAKVALLERADAALVFGSGMGAIATSILATVRRGDHVVAHRELFAQTRTLLEEPCVAWGVETTFVDARRPEEVEAALRPTTRLLYIETPTNPLLQIVPIAPLARLVRPRSIDLFVDSTFASPVLQNPLSEGASLTLHSGTKYLGGHSDVMCGAAAGSAALIERIRTMQTLLGTVLDPQAAWLLLRGIKTLVVRVRRQSASALRIAEFLQKHPAVREARYPALPGSAGFEAAAAQMSGGGGVVSFRLAGERAEARRFVDALREISIATSLGGVETVIELPYDLDFDPEHTAPGRGDDLGTGAVRLSVGLEDPDELIADLAQAIEAAVPAGAMPS